MALDLGDRRTGVALSDAEGWLASPLKVLTAASQKQVVATIAELAVAHEVHGVVVGLPLNMDGTEGPQAARARRLAQRLRKRLGLDVILWDERLSTFAAQESLAHLRPARRRERIDAVAAAIILQGYLDSMGGGQSREPGQ